MMIIPDSDPLGGLATLMGQFPDKAWMITACDMPFLKEEDFKRQYCKTATH